jgi:hypothetical protein
MSEFHPGQLAKEFVFALRESSLQNFTLEAIDSSSPFYALRTLTGTCHSVHMSSSGAIDGLGVKYVTEKGNREVSHSGEAEGKNMVFSMANGECIRRMLVGFGENKAQAIEFHTTLHKHMLGDIYDSECIADVDFTQLDVAIVGFSAAFTPLSLRELSVYFAPITAKATCVPLVSLNLEDTSPAKVPLLYYQSQRQERELLRDRRAIKDCFSHTRLLRRTMTGTNDH